MTERCKRCGALRHAIVHTVLHGAGAHAFMEAPRYWGLTVGEWMMVAPGAMAAAALLWAGVLVFLLGAP